jgi:hypothetical protein
MSEITYSQTFIVGVNVSDEEVLATDTTGDSKSMSVQNNTQMDVAVLVFQDAAQSTQPAIFTVSAGKSTAFGAKFRSFTILSEGLNAGSTVVSPPGKKGGYVGPGQARASDVGSITVICYDEVQSSNIAATGATVGSTVTIGGDTVGIAKDGSDATGTVMPTGGQGIRGWLSAIHNLFRTGGAQAQLYVGTGVVNGANPLPVSLSSNSTLVQTGIQANSQQTVGTTAIAMGIPAGCKSVVIRNTDSTNTVYLGHDNTVTAGTGYPLGPGQALSWDTDSTVGSFTGYAIASAANTVLGYLGVK